MFRVLQELQNPLPVLAQLTQKGSLSALGLVFLQSQILQLVQGQEYYRIGLLVRELVLVYFRSQILQLVRGLVCFQNRQLLVQE